MARKPTYKELEQRVEEFEKKIDRLNREQKQREKKEKILRFVLENTMEGYWVMELPIENLYLSPRYYEMLGYHPNEFASSVETWFQLVHPDDQNDVFQILAQRPWEKTGLYECTFRMKTKSGKWRWNYARGKLIEYDQDGKPLLMVGFNLDVTDRKNAEEELKKARDALERRVKERTHELVRANEQLKKEIEERRQAEEALRENEARYEFLVENVGAAVIYFDTELKIVFANDRVCQDLGMDLETLIGMSFHDLFSKDEADFYTKRFCNIADQGKGGVFEDFVQFPDMKKWMQTHIEIVRNVKKEHIGYIEIAYDITDRKQAEEEQAAGLRRIQRQQAAIVKLATHKAIEVDDFKQAIQTITETVSETIEVERCSVWLLSDDHRELRCESLFERTPNRHSEGVVLQAENYPTYFEALKTGRAINADNAPTDNRTKEFTEGYLVPLGITSMLDAAIRVGGEVVGVVCNEHVGQPRIWQADEIAFAGEVSDQVTQVILNSKRRQAEEERERLISQLQNALDNIKTLKGLLPICAKCKKIRDDKGYWNQIEGYIERYSDALFSHGICPECEKEMYGDQEWYKKRHD